MQSTRSQGTRQNGNGTVQESARSDATGTSARYDRVNGKSKSSRVRTGFRAFTKDNFRENLKRLTGKNPSRTEAHAHHVIPQKFRTRMAKKGINIDDPRFGQWWEMNDHLSKAKGYNERWDKFLGLKDNRSVSEILKFGKDIMQEFGLKVNYK